MCGKSAASAVLAGLLLIVAQLGGSLRPNPALNQLDRSVRQPLPTLPPAPAPRSDQLWVPDRYFPSTTGSNIHVPGHWENRQSDGQYYLPPLPACTSTGQCVTTPAGVRPQAPDNRQSP